MVIPTGTGVVKANDPNQLQEYGGPLEPTENWARTVLRSMECVKRKGTTGKVEPSGKFLEEEKFSFQRAVSLVVVENDIPVDLVLNLDQTTLSYVSPGKYTFCSKGSKNVPIKVLDRQETDNSHFCCSCCWFRRQSS